MLHFCLNSICICLRSCKHIYVCCQALFCAVSGLNIKNDDWKISHGTVTFTQEHISPKSQYGHCPRERKIVKNRFQSKHLTQYWFSHKQPNNYPCPKNNVPNRKRQIVLWPISLFGQNNNLFAMLTTVNIYFFANNEKILPSLSFENRIVYFLFNAIQWKHIRWRLSMMKKSLG